MFVARQPPRQSGSQEETLLAAGVPPRRDPAAAVVGRYAREADQRDDLLPAGKHASGQVESQDRHPKRPFGLTWVVFYWVLTGATYIIMGSVLTVVTGLLAPALAGGPAAGLLGELKREGATALVLAELGGLFIFHYGLLSLVACYGLWTFRKWGIVLARAMAAVNVVLAVVGLIASIVSHVGILAGVVGLVISTVIMAYLFAGAPGFFDRVRQYLRADRLRENIWQGYE
jgi:hypothetical protein